MSKRERLRHKRRKLAAARRRKAQALAAARRRKAQALAAARRRKAQELAAAICAEQRRKKPPADYVPRWVKKRAKGARIGERWPVAEEETALPAEHHHDGRVARFVQGVEEKVFEGVEVEEGLGLPSETEPGAEELIKGWPKVAVTVGAVFAAWGKSRHLFG